MRLLDFPAPPFAGLEGLLGGCRGRPSSNHPSRLLSGGSAAVVFLGVLLAASLAIKVGARIE